MKLFKSKSKPEPYRRHRTDMDERMSVSSTFTYSSRRSSGALNTGRFEEQAKNQDKIRRNSFKTRLLLLLMLFVMLGVAVNFLSLSSSVLIEPMDTSTKSMLSPQEVSDYQAAASKYLASSLLNSNKITVDQSGLSKTLLSRYPQLNAVNISLPFFSSRLIIYVQSDKPALVLLEPRASYAIDSKGRVMYQLTPTSVYSSSIPIVTDESGLQISQGHLALSSNNTTFLQEIYGQLEAKGIKVASMTLPKAAAGELDVRVTGQPYYIKFNLENNDPRQQAGTYLATIAQLKSQGTIPAKYIDVRVDGRAYYQ